jgi:hypothetical protein
MAYEFAAASSQYLSSNNPVSAAPLTVAAWARVNNTIGNKVIVSLNQNSGTDRFVLYVGNAVLYWFVNSSSGFGQAASSTNVSANNWFHACAVETSSNNRAIYLNGGSVGTNTATRTPLNINAVNIGVDRNNNTNVSLMSGLIAEVGIWNAALTAAEVASLAKGMTCDKVRPQSLVFYAPLVRDLIDAKGGLTITNNNGATVANHPRVYA